MELSVFIRVRDLECSQDDVCDAIRRAADEAIASINSNKVVDSSWSDEGRTGIANWTVSG